MTIDPIFVEATLHEVKALLAQETALSPVLRAALNVLLALVDAMLQRSNLNSRNSSQPPSTDPHRPKTPKPKGQRRPGGQNGHVGTTLQPVTEPDDFRSQEGAKMFCRIRSFLSICRKQGVSSTRALTSLFQQQPLDYLSLFAVSATK